MGDVILSFGYLADPQVGSAVLSLRSFDGAFVQSPNVLGFRAATTVIRMRASAATQCVLVGMKLSETHLPWFPPII